MIDSRNNNIYSAIFNEKYELLSDYLAININELIPLLRKYSNITFVGDGSLLHKDLLETELSNCNICFSGNNILTATNIGKCGLKKYTLGEFQNADTIVPMYINKSQAERMQDLKNGNN